MEKAWGVVEWIAFLMGLSGIFLLTSLLWAAFFPYGLIAFIVLFPFVQRLEYVSGSPAWLLSILYGAVLLAIAYGLWVKSKSSRIALICLGIFWIAYAIWDSLAIREGMNGNPDYYEIDSIVVANAVYYGIITVYLFFSKNATAYFSKKA